MRTPSPPDTTAADAEARRQEEANRAREAEERAAREAELDRQREEDRAAQAAWEAEQTRLQEEATRVAEEAAEAARNEEAARLAAAEAQAQRQRDWQAGRTTRAAGITGQIDSSFANYDDDYYNTFESDYLSRYNPGIQSQADEAKRQATLAFAQSGNLNGSAATRRFGLLEQRRAEEQARVASEAADARKMHEKEILAQRRSLLDQALSQSVLGDPSAVPEDLSAGLADIDARIAAFTPNIASSAAAAGSFDYRTQADDIFAADQTTAGTGQPTGGEALPDEDKLPQQTGGPAASLSVVAPVAAAKKKAKPGGTVSSQLYGVAS